MVSQLLELLNAYEEDPSVKLVIIKGEGKAFSAGGAVSVLLNVSWKEAAILFSTAYALDYLIATYAKTQVSLIRGIVMGGGAAFAVHGRFRVVTDDTVFAMPETALGLFPDVGASYYLSRLPGFFGEYVGLTGARLDGAEMLACGLATHFVPLEKFSALEDALCKANTGDPKIINNIIHDFSNKNPKLKEKSQFFRLKTINSCFSRRTVEEIISALEEEADKNKDDWISWTIKTLKKASPTSLKISLRSIRTGRLQGVGQCLIREFRMSCTVVRGKVCRDFFEGCRALLVDKDKNPKVKDSKGNLGVLSGLGNGSKWIQVAQVTLDLLASCKPNTILFHFSLKNVNVIDMITGQVGPWTCLQTLSCFFLITKKCYCFKYGYKTILLQ
ncbi:putative 3-hydroxyisobutyryl-CoA hydrolase [Helianthus annuus]|nr:putative 3-hydroxyisobutyryl-CoA hydrolase [Helianthus annuus]KAJ0572416.1 putative 3-hydroxyisobutyryl-CoA hydrolase [Helianthus annuus]KAJ0910536.1 putative 3-hydroxyisobutyryl-CoA hydrolase [Helianthus annuus]